MFYYSLRHLNGFLNASSMSKSGEYMWEMTDNTGAVRKNYGGSTSWVTATGLPANPMRGVSLSGDGLTVLACVWTNGTYVATGGSTSSWAYVFPRNDYRWGGNLSHTGQYGVTFAITNGYYPNTTNNYFTSVTERRPAGTSTNQVGFVDTSYTGQYMLTSYTYYRNWLSSDYGVNWSEIRPVGNVNNTNLPGDSDMSSDANIIYMSVNSRIYKSINRGSTWAEIQPLGNNNYSWRLACSADGQTVIASGNFRAYISSDGGTTWEEAMPRGSTNVVWSSIDMSYSGNTAWMGTTDNGNVSYTVHKNITSKMPMFRIY